MMVVSYSYSVMFSLLLVSLFLLSRVCYGLRVDQAVLSDNLNTRRVDDAVRFEIPREYTYVYSHASHPTTSSSSTSSRNSLSSIASSLTSSSYRIPSASLTSSVIVSKDAVGEFI